MPHPWWATWPDVNHGTWNMQSLAMCKIPFDFTKHSNIDFAKHCSDHHVTPRANQMWPTAHVNGLPYNHHNLTPLTLKTYMVNYVWGNMGLGCFEGLEGRMFIGPHWNATCFTNATFNQQPQQKALIGIFCNLTIMVYISPSPCLSCMNLSR